MYAIPFSKVAKEKFGRENVANIIALGAITQIFPDISEKSMEKAVLSRVPKRFIDMNKQAFKEGVQLGNEKIQESKMENLSEEEEEI